MYAAVTECGQLIYASDAKKHNNRKWLCPRCHQPVQLIIRRNGRPYFRHKMKRQAQQKGESLIHSKIKQQLADFYIQRGYTVDLEYNILAIDRIADILLQKEKVVIEIQHTPISTVDIRQRTLSYQQFGYRCFWLMTPSLYSFSLKHYWHDALLQYHPQLGYYRLIYNPHLKRIILEWALDLVNMKALNYFEYYGKPDMLINFSKVIIQEKTQKVSLNIAPKKINYMRRVASLRKAYGNAELLRCLYSEGYTLNSLPQWILTEHIHLRGIKTPSWIVLAWIWLQSKLTKGRIEDIILQLLNDQKIHKYDMPFVSDTQWKKDLSTGIELLVNRFDS
ncbi:hypothetical protein HZY86_05265 [Aerococcaceae bacterium DSM 111020]|nr:hypothetical protein [Aerococcaceae bacterium DSM 111020]